MCIAVGKDHEIMRWTLAHRFPHSFYPLPMFFCSESDDIDADGVGKSIRLHVNDNKISSNGFHLGKLSS